MREAGRPVKTLGVNLVKRGNDLIKGQKRQQLTPPRSESGQSGNNKVFAF